MLLEGKIKVASLCFSSLSREEKSSSRLNESVCLRLGHSVHDNHRDEARKKPLSHTLTIDFSATPT